MTSQDAAAVDSLYGAGPGKTVVEWLDYQGAFDGLAAVASAAYRTTRA
jgi:hypothetical protein